MILEDIGSGVKKGYGFVISFTGIGKSEIVEELTDQ
jgi:hypothetical protein